MMTVPKERMYTVNSPEASRIEALAAEDGSNHAKTDYQDEDVLTGRNLTAHATRIANHHLKNDQAHWRTRYADAYCNAYAEQIKQMRTEDIREQLDD